MCKSYGSEENTCTDPLTTYIMYSKTGHIKTLTQDEFIGTQAKPECSPISGLNEQVKRPRQNTDQALDFCFDTNLIVVAIHFSRSASSKIIAAFFPPSYKTTTTTKIKYMYVWY